MAASTPPLPSGGYTLFLQADGPINPLIQELLQGLDHPMTVCSEDELQPKIELSQGFDALHRQDYDAALHFYTLALQKLENLHGQALHHDICVCLSNRGIALEHLKRLPEALGDYERALSMHRVLYGDTHTIDRVSMLEDVGKVLQGLGCYKKSLEKYEEGVELCRKEREAYGYIADEAFALQLAAEVLIDMNYPDKAVTYLDEALSLEEPVSNIDRIIELKSRKAYAYKKLKKFDEALLLFNQVLEMQSSFYKDKNHPLIVATLKQIGTMLEVLGRPFEACDRFHEAYKMQGDEDHISSANTLNLIGYSLTACSNLVSALEYHKKALSMLDRLSTSHDVKYKRAMTHNYISACCWRLHEKDEALKHFGLASDLINELYIPGNTSAFAFSAEHAALTSEHFESFEEVYASHIMASQLIHSKEQSDEKRDLPSVVSMLIDFQREKKASSVQELLSVINACRNCAAYLRTLGRLHEARSGLTRILELYELVFETKDHPDIAICLESLAGVSKELGLFQEAEDHLVKALLMRKRMNVDEVALSLSNLATLYEELGKFEDAERALVEADKLPHYSVATMRSRGSLFYKRADFKAALSCYEAVLKAEGPRVPTLQRIGCILLELGDNDVAMQRFQEAYSLSLMLPRQSSIADSLEQIGHSLGYLGKFHEALDKQKLAHDVREKHFGPDSFITAASLCTVGSYLHRIGKYEEEKSKYETALEILTKVFGRKHLLVSDTLERLGSCLALLKSYDEAHNFLQEAHSIREDLFGEIHPSVALSLDALGFCYSYMGKFGEAKRFFDDALSIRKKIFEKNHPVITLSESYIETCTEAETSPVHVDRDALCLLSRSDFMALIQHAQEYLETLGPESTITLEKNPTGFVRMRIPVPPQFKDRIETIRVNYWLPEVKIKVVEAPHNHPRYFESMIIQGGYTHSLFVKSQEATSYVASRIFKSSQQDKRNIFFFGQAGLHHSRRVKVTQGTMIAYPKVLIHQVQSTNRETMTINAVMKHPENRNYYDVFMPEQSEQDPQVDREYLISDESQNILTKMKAILKIASRE